MIFRTLVPYWLCSFVIAATPLQAKEFTVVVRAGMDASATFSITLSDGYSNSGPLNHGKVEIR